MPCGTKRTVTNDLRKGKNRGGAAAVEGTGPHGTGYPDAAFKALEELYRGVDRLVDRLGPSCKQDGACCRFGSSGLRLFATGLEFAYLRRSASSPWPRSSCCPYLDPAGRCAARKGRTLGCRLYSCDARHGRALEERYGLFHEAIKGIHERYGLPYFYGELRSRDEAMDDPGSTAPE